MDQIGCVDPWRSPFPQGRAFSFFSPVHHSYSRIDYFFIDRTILSLVTKIEYSTIIESDHAPVLLDVTFPPVSAGRPPFANLYLKKLIFLDNKNDNISPSLLWETLKVVIRGEIISYSARINKMQKLKQEQLLKSLNAVDAQYSVFPTPELYRRKLDLQTQYNLLSAAKTERLLLKSLGYVYEHGEKLKSRSVAQQIRKPNGESTIDPGEINNIFTTFYSNLYESETITGNTDMAQFFDDLQAPSVNAVHRAETELPLQQIEIINAIMTMQSGKAPGPHGYPIEFFKTFSNKLSSMLLDMFNDSMSRGSLPQTLAEASISLLLKPGKDQTECNSYRPISLLNSDVKILAKALALRLEPTMHDVISIDQTGFILGHHSFTNIHRLLNIIHSPASSETPEVVVSLDAEKAFDRVEWKYLFTCLRKFGYGPNFISWIKLLYTSPKASVVTNSINRSIFSCQEEPVRDAQSAHCYLP